MFNLHDFAGLPGNRKVACDLQLLRRHGQVLVQALNLGLHRPKDGEFIGISVRFFMISLEFFRVFSSHPFVDTDLGFSGSLWRFHRDIMVIRRDFTGFNH